MTAFPNTPHTIRASAFEISHEVIMRPNVREHYWGYEVRSNQHVLTIAQLMRATFGLIAVATGVAALGVWFIPEMAFVGEATTTKALSFILLVALSLFMAKLAARGTRVRVQIDTAKGELREVVDSAFGGSVVLARYGLDAVEAVEVVASQADPSFGQVQLTMNGLGTIAVGDGAVTMLGPLCDRLRGDCNTEPTEAAQPAIWSGPLAA